MKIINSNNISFESPVADGCTHYQDIVFGGKVIGATRLVESGSILLTPLKETYQCLAPESPANITLCQDLGGQADVSTCEDAGFMFACFSLLDDFLAFVSTTTDLAENQVLPMPEPSLYSAAFQLTPESSKEFLPFDDIRDFLVWYQNRADIQSATLVNQLTGEIMFSSLAPANANGASHESGNNESHGMS